MRRLTLAIAGLGLVLALPAAPTPTAALAATDKATVARTYAEIAQAMYEEALATAKELDRAIDDFLAEPSAEKLEAAKVAWLAARVPYQQTEAYRFGNAVVDDWEGKVNAWPLDEGLIDYVDASYGADSVENPLYTANIVANTAIKHGADTIDTSTISKGLLADTLQEIGGVEVNVATGYHAIEFLLWGQDLNGTAPGAGARPWTDYSSTESPTGTVSGGRNICARRATCWRPPRLDEGRLGARRRGTQGARGEGPGRSARHHADRYRQPVLWRAGGRADEARPAAARPGGGA